MSRRRARRSSCSRRSSTRACCSAAPPTTARRASRCSRRSASSRSPGSPSSAARPRRGACTPTTSATSPRRAETELQGPSSRRSLQQLAVEHHNLRTALAWAADNENETLLRLAAALWRFWYVRGHLTEGRTWLARALADHTQPEERRAPALRGASAIAAIAGDLASARGFAEELVEARRSLGDDEDLALALVVLANVTAALGEQDVAVELYGEAATYARRAGARPALAGIMSNLGYLSLLRDDPAAARETCREAAALFEELGFGEEAAGAWLNAAAAELLLDDLDEARRSFAAQPRPATSTCSTPRASPTAWTPPPRSPSTAATRVAQRSSPARPPRRAIAPAARCRRSSSGSATTPSRP